MKSFVYQKPETIEKALNIASKGGRIKAGGTDLLGLMKDRIESPGTIVNLTGIKELKRIEERPNSGFSIGAMASLAEVAAHSGIRKRFPLLAEAAASAASPQIRNLGTIGGNLCQRPRCWYFRGEFHCLRKGGDTCFAVDGKNKFHCVVGGGPCYIVHPSDTAVALLALNATLLIQDSKGQRPVPISQFFVLPEKDVTRETILKQGEILTAIQVPGPPPGNRSVYLKTSERGVFDFATVSAGVQADVRSNVIHSARVALGGVAPIPWFEKKVSAALNGIALSDQSAIRKASDLALKDAEPLEENGFKIKLARNLVFQAIMKLS
jgi:xanthine dehydrogenase YagS FAD-binding subunit